MLEERVSAPSARLGRLAARAGERNTAALLAWLPLVLIVACAFAVTAIYVRSIHTFTVMPDELGYVKQSIEIARTGLPVFPHNFYFASWAQLLPAISAPIFGSMGMVDAFYAAHTLYAFLLASTAIPAYLLARELRLGSLAACLAAALSVVVPWLALAGLVMTEVVAYPVFSWAMLAIVRAVHAPSRRRDLLAIAAIALAFFARTQFLVLGPILVIAVVAHDGTLALAARGEAGARQALSGSVRQAVDRHLVLFAASVLAIIVVAFVAITGSGQTALGNYVDPVQGQLLPAGTVGAGLSQLDGVALGIGVVPLTLAATWALATVLRPQEPSRHAFAVVLVITVSVFILMVGSFQRRFLGGATTDRYLFYLVPILFVGTVAWLVDRRGSLRLTVIVSGLVAWMVVDESLHYSTAVSILNPSYGIHRVLIGKSERLTDALGLSRIDPRVLIAIVVSAFTMLALLVRRRLRTWQALLAVTVPLFAYGVVTTGYALTKLSQQYSVEPANHPQSLTWIDRSVPAGSRVGLVIAPNESTAEQDPINTWYTWWQPSFWNKTVQRAFVLPGADSFAQGFANQVTEDLGHGRLVGVDAVGYVVKLTSDARFGLRASLVNTPVSTYLLYKLRAGAPLSYGTAGLDQYAQLEPSAHPYIRIFSANAAGTVSERVVLTLETTAVQADCPCHVQLGSGYGDAVLAVAPPSVQSKLSVSRTVTVPPRGYAQLNLDVRNRRGAPAAPYVKLTAVQITAL